MSTETTPEELDQVEEPAHGSTVVDVHGEFWFSDEAFRGWFCESGSYEKTFTGDDWSTVRKFAPVRLSEDSTPMLGEVLRRAVAMPEPDFRPGLEALLGQATIRPATPEEGMPLRLIAAERALEAMTAERDRLRDILGNVWLYVDWRWLTKQLTTEQKELWATAVEDWSRKLNEGDPAAALDPLVADRWWLCPTCGPDNRSDPNSGPHKGCCWDGALGGGDDE
jgi:hypothetical protein